MAEEQTREDRTHQGESSMEQGTLKLDATMLAAIIEGVSNKLREKPKEGEEGTSEFGK